MTDAGFLEAKSYLLESGGDTSLYDHLSEVLLQVLEKKPKNVLESFENISRTVKSNRLTATGENPPQKANIDGPLLSVAKRQIKLFEKPDGEDGDANGPATAIVPNVFKEQQIYEQCGVGIGREEAVLLQFAIQELAKTVGDSVISLRFWGKILGTKADYYIVEGTLADGAEDNDPEPESGDANGGEAADAPSGGDDDQATALGELEDVPKPFFKKPPVIPMELGSGGNKHRYWVCSEPSQAWTKLPPVTPSQITVARKIKKLFTGTLAAPVHSYPPFKGTEANLLRAQIARISAATHVSPAGYFAFPEEEPEEEDVPLVLETVQDFEGLAMEELGKPDAWAHHSAALLPQGRCQWYSVTQDKEENDDDDDEDVDDAPEEEEPETAPPLLAALVEDQPNDADYGAAWSAKTYPSYAPEVACISSNNWPGAYAVATDRGTYFRNLYIGWGQKHSTAAFVPPAIQSVELEYSKPLELAQDPTVEEEQALEEEREDKEGGDLEDDDDEGDEDED
jgi:radial spoke head protein 4A